MSNQNERNQEETSKGLQEPQNDNDKNNGAANDYNYAPNSKDVPEFDEFIKEKPRGAFIRLKNANETVVLHFKSNKPTARWDDFKGKAPEPVPVYTFPVTTPDEPNKEKSFDVTSKRLGSDIKAYYEKGFHELEITRLGTKPVSYRVIPVVARERQRQMAA